MPERPAFDFPAFYGALDAQRRERDLDWYALADELWQQSSTLNIERPDDHPLCGGAVGRLGGRGATTCQYALFMLRWLDRAPEDFLTGPVVDGAALYGLLARLESFGVALIAIRPVPNTSEVH